MDKESLVSEPQASFKAFPFFDLHNWEAEGQWQCGRLSLLTFFGEAKKVSGRRATPGQRTLIITTSNSNKERKTLDSPLQGAPAFANTGRLPSDLHAYRNPRQSLRGNDAITR